MTVLDTRPTPLPATELDPASFTASNTHLIPELAPQWQALDLAEILRRPAAFCSVSQSNSLYKPGGVQYAEGHAFRGNLENTIRVVKAARQAANFRQFAWVGYSVFRDAYPQTAFDAAQYQCWTGPTRVLAMRMTSEAARATASSSSPTMSPNSAIFGSTPRLDLVA